MGFYLHDGTYIDDPSMTQAQADAAYTANQARNAQPSVPNLPQSDLARMIDWSVPARKDAQGRTYQTTYTGAPFYVNDGSTPMPPNTFMHEYAWDPTTGTYKQRLNRGGVLGALEGAAAVAGPAFIGPLLTGSPTIFAGTPAAAAASSSDGLLPSQSLVDTPGMITGPATASGNLAASGAASSAAGAAANAAAATPAANAAAATPAALKRLEDAVTNPRALLGAAALVPTVARAIGGNGGGSGSSPFSAPTVPPVDLSAARDAYAQQAARVSATQPIFDALVAQAYGTTPSRYRGAAPASVPATATQTPSGAYVYRGPTFGK